MTDTDADAAGSDAGATAVSDIHAGADLNVGGGTDGDLEAGNRRVTGGAVAHRTHAGDTMAGGALTHRTHAGDAMAGGALTHRTHAGDAMAGGALTHRANAGGAMGDRTDGNAAAAGMGIATNDVAVVSRTALMAAAARAAHLLVDDTPHLFEDRLAVALLGDRADELLEYHRAHGRHLVLAGARAQAICRSRFTEDTLERSGHTQYVILGAGLDTYAYRAAGSVRVYEVDQPPTQEFKRAAVRRCGFPERAEYVPIDFERDTVLARLITHGFDPRRPAVVSWLGVTMYLTKDAVERTVADVARFADGTILVLDHMVPQGDRDATAQQYVDAVGPVNAQHGEPWRSFFSPSELAELLNRHDMTAEHTNQHEILGSRTHALQPSNLTWITRGTLRHRAVRT